MSLFIDDTTLRDGEQTAGVVFTNQEKVFIARMLDKMGVHEIEVGIPAMGGDEAEAIQDIAHLDLQARIITWNRPTIGDIEASISCGVSAVAIGIPTSDIHIEHVLRQSREWVLERISRATEYAKKRNLYVSINAGDASRADYDFLVQFTRNAREAGADRLRFCDTVGILDPFQTYNIIRQLIEEAGIDIEIHTHNDFGMATANAIAGVKAGAKFVNTTVNGLGERAGNACLAEVVMALKHIEGTDPGIDTTQLRAISEYVAEASQQTLPQHKSITGDSIFTHESGIHADGMIKHQQAYEAFSPDEVGATRRILIGKHSGSHSIQFKFATKFDIELSEDFAREILAISRAQALDLKRSLCDEELLLIYRVLCQEKHADPVSPNASSAARN